MGFRDGLLYGPRRHYLTALQVVGTIYRGMQSYPASIRSTYIQATVLVSGRKSTCQVRPHTYIQKHTVSFMSRFEAFKTGRT